MVLNSAETLAISPTRKRAWSMAWQPMVTREGPGRRWRIGHRAPTLRVAETGLVDLAQATASEHVPRQLHRRNEAVVVTAQVLDSRLLRRLPHCRGVSGAARQGLLANDVLAGGYGGKCGLHVGFIRGGIVEHAEPFVLHQAVPVGVVAVEAVTHRRVGYPLVRPAGDCYELGSHDTGPVDVGHGAQGVAVGLAHEAVAEHAHAGSRAGVRQSPPVARSWAAGSYHVSRPRHWCSRRPGDGARRCSGARPGARHIRSPGAGGLSRRQ